MQWAISKSVEEIGERGELNRCISTFYVDCVCLMRVFLMPLHVTGEKLKHKELQGYGNKTIIDGKEQTVGAGGKFGGVHLAMSDQETQKRNMAMLKAMFDREKKRRHKDVQRNDDGQNETEES